MLAKWTEKLAGGPQSGTSDSPHLQGSWVWVDNKHDDLRLEEIQYSVCDAVYRFNRFIVLGQSNKFKHIWSGL